MTVRDLKYLLSHIENENLPVYLFVKEDDRNKVYHAAALEILTEIDDWKTNKKEIWLEGFKTN